MRAGGDDSKMNSKCELKGADPADSELPPRQQEDARVENRYVHEWRPAFVSGEDTGGRRLPKDVAEYIKYGHLICT